MEEKAFFDTPSYFLRRCFVSLAHTSQYRAPNKYMMSTNIPLDGINDMQICAICIFAIMRCQSTSTCFVQLGRRI